MNISGIEILAYATTNPVEITHTLFTVFTGMVRLENPAIPLYLVPVLFDIPNMLWFIKNSSRPEGMAAGRETGVLHDVPKPGAGPC